MSSAKRKFVIVLPPILTVPPWFSSVSAIILSKKMSKRVGKSRHPSEPFSYVVVMVDCAGCFVVDAFYGSDQVVIDVMRPHGYPQN